MKISLTDKINRNREAFDHAVPPVGHFERFEEKLARNEQRRTRQFYRWIATSSIAAMLAVTLIFQFTRMQSVSPVETESVAEVAGYYKLQLKEEIDKIQDNLNKLDISNRQEVMEDLCAILKDSDESLTANGSLTTEEQISLIVLHYQSRMETLQHIYSIIEDVPHRNNNL
ncbi:hypothetical protein [Odoribacter lunatus]|uniref:hypothetical protein n=1 Tax=Odoribacter lunatus TaxID=2941335 RepID=UPI0020403E64|nr:hypothetical protein [Odoribacter lunatus]